MQWRLKMGCVTLVLCAEACGGQSSGRESSGAQATDGGSDATGTDGASPGSDGALRGADGASPRLDGSTDGKLDHSGTPLAGTLQFAFKSGYDSAEEIWLRDTSGGVVRVSEWEPSPELGPWSSWSTSGYTEGAGRFGPLRFDHSGAFLLFRETLDDHDLGAPGLERLVAYEVATGRAREVLRARRNALRMVIVGEDATVLVVEPSDGQRDLYDFDAGVATSIQVPAGTALSMDRYISPMPRLGGRSQLLIDGQPPLEKGPGGWAPSTVFSGAVGTWWSVAASAGGDRLCVVGRPDGTASTGVGYILGGPTSIQVQAPSYGSCAFAIDGSQVYFHGRTGTAAHELGGALLWTVVDADFFGESRGKLYASQSDGIIALNPADGTSMSMVLSSAGVAAGCGGPGSTGVVFLPRGADQTALVKVSCGCTDCDISGTLAVNLDTSEVTVVEQPIEGGDHAVYSALRLTTDDFALASTQGDHSSGVPAAGSFFLVHQQGASELVGPLPGVTGFIHGLMAPGPEGLEAASMDPWF